jgi:ABC-type sugar transport system ATPase subunit
MEVKELHQRLGTTSVFVTHDQEEALSLSDRIAVMRAGKIEHYGTPEEVYSYSASKYVARFIGSPQLDIYQGRFESFDGMLTYCIGSARFPMPPLSVLPGQPLDLGVRPEHVLLGNEGIPAIVHLVQPIGPFTYVTVNWDGGSATARVSGVSRLHPKDQVHISFDPEGLLFFDRETSLRVDLS